MDQNEKQQVIFGAFDGLTTSLGAVLAMLLQHTSTPHLFNIVLGLAVSGGLSMAWGEYLSDPHHNMTLATYMGAATFGGSFLPALPLLMWRNWFGFLLTALVIYIVCNVIGGLRSRDGVLTHQIYAGVMVVIIMVVGTEWITGGIG